MKEKVWKIKKGKIAMDKRTTEKNNNHEEKKSEKTNWI